MDERGRRRAYSTPQVAKAISGDPRCGTTVSRVYLATLRSGSNTNPTIAVVRAIARFFDEHRGFDRRPVTAAFLLGEDEDDEDRELRRRLADHQVRAIAMRAGDMSPAQRRQVLRMLDVLHETTAGDGAVVDLPQ
ncbi:hypothetical protein ABZ079_23395 [Streptomyces sp. NPDC006314]|uniref:hypothetical protein n=1 Tax=Streptomyces sp. NPDC006314 TaxID=3154475 RepID=UPI0033A1280E